MKAKEFLDAGQLSAAIEQLTGEVKSHPTDTQRRTFLFELLCFAGEYQRAIRHLEVIAHQSTGAAVGVQVYRNILVAEEARRRLFSDGLQPHLLFDPPPYLSLHLAAINRLREQQPAEAKALLDQAEQARPPLRGEVDGTPFQDFRDGDDLMAPLLEVIVHDRYIWLPFEQIKHLQISPPKRLRDLLWIPATLETHPAPIGEVFLPVLYAGSCDHADDRVRLGRMTDWKVTEGGPVLGVGQRLFLIDDQDRAMLEVREIKFEAVT
ncbi:MAG: SciE type virulence protein [Nitrospinota bacterium]|nr:MAG: SciE type virulence protein [Nitrospinota bacterium]